MVTNQMQTTRSKATTQAELAELFANFPEIKVISGENFARPEFHAAHKTYTVINGRAISEFSPRYAVVPYVDLIKTALEVFNEAGHTNVEVDVAFSNHGAKMMATVTFTEKVIAGEGFKVGLLLRNSADGSKPVSVSGCAIRGWCSNGMIFGKVFGLLKRKHHKGQLPGDLKEALKTLIKKAMLQLAPYLVELDRTIQVAKATPEERTTVVVRKAKVDQGGAIIEPEVTATVPTVLLSLVGKKVAVTIADLISQDEDPESNGGTAWDVYNGITRLARMLRDGTRFKTGKMSPNAAEKYMVIADQYLQTFSPQSSG